MVMLFTEKRRDGGRAGLVGIKRCISDIGALGHLSDTQVTGAQEEVTSADGHIGILSTPKILGPWDCTELLRE